MTHTNKLSWGFRVFGVVLLGVFALITTSAYAQLPTATILGTVKDSSGGTVAAANVTVTNVDTGLSRSQPTGDAGEYRIPALPVGNYEIQVMKEGFDVAKRTGVTLVVDQQANLDFTLQVGSTGQTITVTGEAPQVNTTNAATGEVIAEEQVQDLPLNGRNLLDLTLLTPGVSQTSITSGPYGENGTMFSSNGSSLRSNMTMIDGAITTTYMGLSWGSVSGTSLGVDGVKEYKVVTSMFGAEYGLVMGSQTAMVSKGGTNQFHGDAFEYIRNSVLDAADYFQIQDLSNHNGCGTNRSLAFPCKRVLPFQRNNFGAAFGGPLKKDKTFFYGVYEGLRQRLGEPVTGENTFAMGCFVGSSVSAAAAESATTASAGIPLFINNTASNPFGGAGACPGAPKVPAGSPSAGATTNVISVGCPAASVRLDGCAVAPSFNPPSPGSFAFQNLNVQQLISQWPQPNVAGLPGTNFTFPFVQPTREDYAQLRLDQNISTNDTLFARYTADIDGYFDHETYPQWIDHFRTNNLYSTASETHIFSPTVVNTGRFSFSRTQLIENFDAPGLTSLQIIPGEYAASVSPGGGITAGGGGGGDTPGGLWQNLYTLSDDVFWTKGKHAFKFGTLVNWYTLSYHNKFTTNGTVTFTGSTPTNLWEGVYSALSGAQFDHAQDRIWNFNTMGFYAQDDYKILPRVTLNLGLRYEFMTTISCPANGGNCTGIQNVRTYQFGDPTNIHPYLSPAYHNISPRIGFAWDVFGDGKTSVRGGGGIYYDTVPNPGAEQAANGSGDPSLARLNNITVPAGNSDPVPLTLNPFPPYNPTAAGICVFPIIHTPNAPGCTAGVGATFTNGTPVVLRTARVIDYNLQQPTSAQWSLTIDRQLPWGLAMTAGYVGSKGWHIVMTTEGNPTVPLNFNGPNGTPTYCVPNTAGNGLPGACTLASTSNPIPRTNTNFGQTQHYTAGAWTDYQGLQISVNKRVSHGLQMQFNYTYAKSLDDGQKVNSDAGSSAYAGQNTVGFLQLGDKGPSFTDLRHNARFNWTYHAPGFGGDKLWAKPLQGWWFGSIFSFNTGYPINPSSSGRSLETNGNVTDRPNLDASYNASKVITGDPNHWFDATMFDLPAAGTLGNAGRNILRGPDLKNLDFSINKDTHVKWLGEAGSIQFRAEFFNILNHPNWLAPAGTLWAGQAAPSVAPCTPSGCAAAATACGVGVNITCNVGTSASGQFCDARVIGCAVPITHSTDGTLTAGKIVADTTKNRTIQLALKVIF